MLTGQGKLPEVALVWEIQERQNLAVKVSGLAPPPPHRLVGRGGRGGPHKVGDPQ